MTPRNRIEREIGPLSEADRARFFEKVRKGEGDACWLWTASTNNHGYGWFGVGDAVCLAHRVAWVLEHGSLPSRTKVLHTCDTPACVRPSHLITGTQKQNLEDMATKGRGRNHNTGRSHCKRGHEFTPENTKEFERNGRIERSCRVCARDRARQVA